MNAARPAQMFGLLLASLLVLAGPAAIRPARAQDDTSVSYGSNDDPRASYNAATDDDEGDDDRDAPARVADDRDDQQDVHTFARIRALEGNPQVRRADGTLENLSLNLPVYGGDRIDTGSGQRVELQLPDGTLLRVDVRSSVDLYALADLQGGGARTTQLGVRDGSIQADVVDPRRADFRVDTPSASVYPEDRSVFRVDVEGDDAVRVSVTHGRVEVAGQDGSTTVETGERTRVVAGGGPRTPWAFSASNQDAFDVWVSRRGEAYAMRTPGREYNELPPEVRPYYGELSRYGRWVWTDEYGWTWKPDDVSSDWSPYVSGYWDYGPWGPVWVGGEPWGWSVYRYGRWSWAAGGWFWIPGRVFAPAHVYWYYGPDSVGWCPLGYWDTPVYVGIGFGWGDPWFNGYPWTFVDYGHFYHYDIVRVRRGHVIPTLRDGVVGRRAIFSGPRGRVFTNHGTAVSGAIPHELTPDVYRRARTLAGRGALRPVSEAGPALAELHRDRVRPNPELAQKIGAPARPFVEGERVRHRVTGAPASGGGQAGGGTTASGPRRESSPPARDSASRGDGAPSGEGSRSGGGSGGRGSATPPSGGGGGGRHGGSGSGPRRFAPRPDLINHDAVPDASGPDRMDPVAESTRVAPRVRREADAPARVGTERLPVFGRSAAASREAGRPAEAGGQATAERRRGGDDRPAGVRQFFGRLAEEDRNPGAAASTPNRPADAPRGYREPRRFEPAPGSGASAPPADRRAPDAREAPRENPRTYQPRPSDNAPAPEPRVRAPEPRSYNPPPSPPRSAPAPRAEARPQSPPPSPPPASHSAPSSSHGEGGGGRRHR